MISKYTRRFLFNTKIREGEEDWHLKNMSSDYSESFVKFELTDEQEALRQLNGLIETIATGNNSYTLDSFVCDVKESIREVNDNV